MKITKFILACTVLTAVSFSQAQTIPAARRVDWSNPGYGGPIPTTYGATINITSYGGNGNDLLPDDAALTAALAAANPNVLTMIYFPTGKYIFNQEIRISQNNIVLKGAGPSYTTFHFRNTAGQCIAIVGSESGSDIPIVAGTAKGTTVLTLSNAATLGVNDYIELKRDMLASQQCTPPGADPECANVVGGHFYGQVVKIANPVDYINNKITLEDGLSMDHALSTFRVRKLNMVKNVGIQDLMITEDNVSGDITDYTILVRRAAKVWISGVESWYARAHHFGVDYSTRVEIRGCYIHNSSIYDGTGGYSVYIGMRSTNCLVEDNIFTFHRHSIVLSGSPNRNVIGYNYSTESQYTNSPSEFVLHGFYPHANLFEGNVAGAMDIDEYWGWNGPFNTIFRNKFDNWSILNAPSINIVGNTAVANPYPNPPGLLAANNSITAIEPTFSHYLSSKPDFLSVKYTWPPIGAKTSSSSPISQIIPAEQRYNNGGQFTINRRDPIAGYSIANTGLYSVFNGSSGSGNIARTYRNTGELSIGSDGYYANSDLNWVAGPVTTVRLSSGQEEILSAYNYNHPTNKYAVVYLSSGKNPNVQSLVFNMTNCVITALASGDFNGDGVDEIVIAYLQNGMPRLYKSTTPTNLTQTLLYSNGSIYWTISALCTGDFDGNGNDELIIGMNSSGVDTRIFKSVTVTDIGTAIYTHTSGYWRVGALAAIDSDGNGSDELIEGFNSSDGTAIYRSIGATTSSGLIHQYTGGNYRVAAMAVGDMDNDGDEELITGFNYTKPGTINRGVIIFKSETVGKIDDVRIYFKEDLGMDLRSLVVEKIHPTAPGGKPLATAENAGSITSDRELLVSPNPASRMVTISITGSRVGTQSVEMYNSLGTLVLTGELKDGTGILELTDLKPGVYFIRANTENGTLQEKVIIQ